MQGLGEELKIIGKRMADALNKMREAVADFFQKMYETRAAKDTPTAKDTPKVNIKPLKKTKKAFYNRPEYNCIKPNTKPYSARKRLYRVQVR